MKKINKYILCIVRIIIATVIMAAFLNIPIHASAETTKKKKLTQNTETHTFSNSSDGSFSYTYAKKSKYYKGWALDESTGIKYAFISYQDKIYAVVMGNKKGYNGSYDTSSFTGLMSASFNPKTTKTVLNVIKNKTGDELLADGFYYDDDYSIITTGWSLGKYYIKGKKAGGIHLIDDAYYYFVKGKQITKKGWYQHKNAYIYISNKKVKYKFNGVSCYKYTKGVRKKVTNAFIDIDGAIYRFDSKGALAQGFCNIDGEYYYFIDGLYKTKSLKTINGKIYYFGEDGKAVKSSWVNVKKTTRYFNKNGVNIKVYYKTDYKDTTLAGKYKERLNGNWSFFDKGIRKINGKMIYFKKGVTYTSTCWYAAATGYKYYIKDGEVIYRLKEADNESTLMIAVNNNWQKAYSTWTPAKKGVRMYFDKDGNLTYKFFTNKYSISAYRNTEWKYNATKNKWKKVKNKVINIDGLYYCAGSDGTLVKTEGWYSFSDTSTAYINNKGKVIEYVYYDKKKGCSIYKMGETLSNPVSGLITVQIEGTKVYYFVDSSGKATTGELVYGNFVYQFDEYGRAYSRRLDGVINWSGQTWLDRLTVAYLGTEEIDCNVFVDRALIYAGGDTPNVKMSVKYEDEINGGILVSDSVTATQWGEQSSVLGQTILSNGINWTEKDDVPLNDYVVDFSYDELDPGDLIIYYKDGETDASHISIYLGRFVSAEAVKNYLKKLGIKKEIREACVKDWGQYYDNDGTYWCIHGGMGSSRQVYISNSCYTIPSGDTYTYGRKIVNLFQ